MLYMKVKTVNPKSSHHKKNFLFLKFYIYMRRRLFTKFIVISFHDVCKSDHMLYILNLHGAICQLYLNKTGRKKYKGILWESCDVFIRWSAIRM